MTIGQILDYLESNDLVDPDDSDGDDCGYGLGGYVNLRNCEFALDGVVPVDSHLQKRTAATTLALRDMSDEKAAEKGIGVGG